MFFIFRFSIYISKLNVNTYKKYIDFFYNDKQDVDFIKYKFIKKNFSIILDIIYSWLNYDPLKIKYIINLKNDIQKHIINN